VKRRTNVSGDRDGANLTGTWRTMCAVLRERSSRTARPYSEVSVLQTGEYPASAAPRPMTNTGRDWRLGSTAWSAAMPPALPSSWLGRVMPLEESNPMNNVKLTSRPTVARPKEALSWEEE